MIIFNLIFNKFQSNGDIKTHRNLQATKEEKKNFNVQITKHNMEGDRKKRKDHKPTKRLRKVIVRMRITISQIKRQSEENPFNLRSFDDIVIFQYNYYTY